MPGMNLVAAWKRIVIALLIGCALTAALAIFRPRFKAGSIPDFICEVLLLPGKLAPALFNDRGTASPEVLWRSGTATAGVLAAIAWWCLGTRRRVSDARSHR
jgi:hypothetical protein